METNLRRNSKLNQNPSVTTEGVRPESNFQEFEKPDFDQSQAEEETSKSLVQQHTKLIPLSSEFSKFSQHQRNQWNSYTQGTKSILNQNKSVKESRPNSRSDSKVEILNDKIKYLEEEVVILNNRLKNNSNVHQLPQEMREDDEFEVDLKILKRKNETLSKQNEYLKKIQEQMQKEKLAEKKKLKEKNKVLTQMIGQYEAYTTKLKKSLQETLAKNQEQKEMLELFQVKTGEYEQKIQEFQSTLNNLRAKKSLLQSNDLGSPIKNSSAL